EEMYALGQRDFGENYVQELVEKQGLLPADIQWHFIGHLQSNKVKFIAPFVYMIHGVDGLKLLQTIDRQGAMHGRKIRCLLQVHIAVEETKFGLDKNELIELLQEISSEKTLAHVQVCGLMGMASFTDDIDKVRSEFRKLKSLFDEVKEKFFYHEDQFSELSMGMSGDYTMAVEEGSTMVRIGSLLFGSR
ncbi:MAG: YggS family pyridoxal phosphate-dependent enzyme, partial [Chitinophagaceae bacterium]